MLSFVLRAFVLSFVKVAAEFPCFRSTTSDEKRVSDSEILAKNVQCQVAKFKLPKKV